MLATKLEMPVASTADVDQLPLVVDLDGTLSRVDLLKEGLFRACLADPRNLFRAVWALRRGKAALKQEVARRAAIDPTLIPYSSHFLEWLRNEQVRGRSLCLATGSDRVLADRVADHLGIFDHVIASDGETSMTGSTKAAALVELFGEGGFVYAGNSTVDEDVWARAAAAVVVNGSPATSRAAERATQVVGSYDAPRPARIAWLRALRPHQWVKNLLVFLPLIASHRCFEIALTLPALMIFAAFCLCASSIYLINDLVDLDADRRHATKRRRPFAAGDLGVDQGLAGTAILLTGGLGLAALIGLPALIVAATYVATSIAYSFYLKRRLALDVFVLAGLYVVRVIAGGVALGIPVSSWLLGFCGFCFLSLALAKRYLELRRATDRGVNSAAGRAYLASDREIIAMFGIGSAMAAGVLLTLYIASDAVKRLYPGPELLWAWAPLLLYWQCRVWTIAHRGHLSDDPVQFAVRDKVTYAVGAGFLAVMWAAATFDVSPMLAVVK